MTAAAAALDTTPRTDLDDGARPRLYLVRDAGGWQPWVDQFTIDLQVRGLSRLTIISYLRTMALFTPWAVDQGLTAPDQVRRVHMKAWAAWLMDTPGRHGTTRAASTIRTQLRNMSAFWSWWADETEAQTPMRGVQGPESDATPTPVLTDDELRDLLAVCRGQGFAQRRDTALMRVLLDSGLRAAELMSLAVDDVDVAAGLIRLRKGKGGDPRVVGFGAKTAQALARYLRVRGQHKDARLPALWLPSMAYGHGMGTRGLADMLNRRADQAGITSGVVHPHRFRHTAYAALDGAGITGTQAMTLMGWKTRAMLDHYGADNAAKRAVAAQHQASVGDRI